MRGLKRSTLVASFVLVLGILSGCVATVPTMPEESDAAAEEFSPSEGMGNLYVTRTSGLGFEVLYQVYLNQRLVGSIAPNTYMLFELPPGKHEVAVLTKESQASQSVDVSAGDNEFVDVVPKIGWAAARAELEVLPTARGKTAVHKGERAKVLGN